MPSALLFSISTNKLASDNSCRGASACTGAAHNQLQLQLQNMHGAPWIGGGGGEGEGVRVSGTLAAGAFSSTLAAGTVSAGPAPAGAVSAGPAPAAARSEGTASAGAEVGLAATSCFRLRRASSCGWAAAHKSTAASSAASSAAVAALRVMAVACRQQRQRGRGER